MKELRELQQERGELVTKMREINDAIIKEEREWTAEEGQEYARCEERFEKLTEQIDRQEKLEGREAYLNELEGDPIKPDPEGRGGVADEEKERLELETRAFRGWLLNGHSGLDAQERRALQMDIDESGGFTVAPQQFVAELIKFIDDVTYIRQWATVRTVINAESLGAPSLDADPADADWTSELDTGTEDSTMDFGKRELRPHPVAKRIKVSNKLMRASTMGIEALVRERLGYKFGVTEEKGFLTGSGSQQPLGVFTASADGISTSRDVSTGNSTTEIGADGLIEAKHSLKTGYWDRLRWLFHRDAIKRIRKLKTGDGQYLWQPGLVGNIPDRIVESPYFISEFAPNTFTTGLYVGIVGDFSLYWIADALSMTVQRLVELYAATNQTGFIGRLETDGMPVLEEGFARVKLA